MMNHRGGHQQHDAHHDTDRLLTTLAIMDMMATVYFVGLTTAAPKVAKSKNLPTKAH